MSLKWCNEATTYVGYLTEEKRTSVDYVLFTLDDPKKNPTMILKYPDHMGKGGRAQVEAILTSGACDDAIMAGAFLTSAIDERGSVVSVRRKYVYLMWVGPSVGILVKGKANSFSGQFRDKFPGCAIYLQLMGGDVDALMEKTLEHNLLSAGGAHKPTRYSFTNRTLIGSLNLPEGEDITEEPIKYEPPKKTPEQIEAERKAKAEAEARRKAEEEAKQKAAEEEAARQQALEERRRKQEQERIEALKAREDARRRAQEEEMRRRAEAEKAARDQAAKSKHLVQANSTLDGKKLIFMMTSMPKDLSTSANQQRLQTMLDGLGLPKEEIEVFDGCDMSLKDRRSQLFEISGLRAQYPQLFLLDGSGNINFVGDFEAVVYYNDSGQLKEVLGVTTKTSMVQSNSTLDGKKIIFMMTSMPKDLSISTNQQRLQTMLDGLGLPKEEIEVFDGCDMSLKDRRSQLFEISGLRAQYPQIFLLDGSGNINFIGDFEAMVYYNDSGQLKEVLGVTTKTSTGTPGPVPTESAPSADASVEPTPVSTDKTVVESEPVAPVEEPPAAVSEPSVAESKEETKEGGKEEENAPGETSGVIEVASDNLGTPESETPVAAVESEEAKSTDEQPTTEEATDAGVAAMGDSNEVNDEAAPDSKPEEPVTEATTTTEAPTADEAAAVVAEESPAPEPDAPVSDEARDVAIQVAEPEKETTEPNVASVETSESPDQAPAPETKTEEISPVVTSEKEAEEPAVTGEVPEGQEAPAKAEMPSDESPTEEKEGVSEESQPESAPDEKETSAVDESQPEPATEETPIAVEDPQPEPASLEKELPVAEEPQPEPVPEEKEETPVAEESKPEPAPEENVEAPVAEETQPEPAPEENVEAPVAEETQPESPAEEKVETPAVEETQQEPAPEKKVETPAVEETQQEHAPEEKVETPIAEETQQEPAPEENVEAPVAEETQPESAAEEKVETPAVEETQPEPATEETPVVEESQPEPASEEKVEAPVAEEIQPATAPEEKEETPASADASATE